MLLYLFCEYKVLWTVPKDETFSVKTLYKALEPRRQGVFPTSVIWNPWVPPRVGAAKGGFLCLGGYMEEGFHFGPYLEERLVFGE